MLKVFPLVKLKLNKGNNNVPPGPTESKKLSIIKLISNFIPLDLKSRSSLLIFECNKITSPLLIPDFCHFSDNSFKIPADAKQGTWKIIVRSGTSSNSTEFEVLSTIEEGMTLTIEEGLEIGSETKTITINVSGAQQNVTVKILTDNGEIIDSFTSLASDQGNISLPWSIPSNMEPGTYTIDVTDAFDTVQITERPQFSQQYSVPKILANYLSRAQKLVIETHQHMIRPKFDIIKNHYDIFASSGVTSDISV